MSEAACRILLAEDDANLGQLLSGYLKSAGYEVTWCRDGKEALAAFEKDIFQLCLLDVMMPSVDGFEAAREIRRRDKDVPLIFLSARSLKEDKMTGYTSGADDYITKPFDAEELVWKIRALIRRVPAGSNQFRIGAYTFDHSMQLLSTDGTQRRVTQKEADILRYLYLHRNRIIRREALLNELWGENDYFAGRSLDVFITKIRRYLKADPSLNIENVFGVGFIFNVEEKNSQ